MTGSRLCIWHAFSDRLKRREIFVQQGADANAVSPNRIAVIHSAAASRNAALVKLVLQAGANPNLQQQGGYTALHEAAMHNSVERAQALLDAGADLAIRSDNGLTAAEMAAQRRQQRSTGTAYLERLD